MCSLPSFWILRSASLSRHSIEMANIFEESLNEIFMFDAEQLKFVEVNRGARENIGYSIDELREMTPLDIKPTFTLELFETVIAPLRRGEQEKIVFETIHERKNGTHYPVEVHLQLKTLDRKPVFVAIILDITARHEADRLKLAIAKQRRELIRNFIRDTSHEFRTSLAIINTKTYLLNKSLDNPQQEKQLGAILSQVSRIDSLVESLHRASIFETTAEIDKSLVSVDRIIQQAINQLQLFLEKKDIRLQLDLEEPELQLCANEDLLITAVYNVLKNAIEFNHDGGHVRVRVNLEEDNLRIIVEDTGTGIPQDELTRIFDYLYRVDSARSIDGGTGMGLSITRRILQLHGGSISVESEVDKGSLFTLQLPVDGV